MDNRDEATIMANAGITIDEIAEELGVTTNTVREWIKSRVAASSLKDRRNALIVRAYVSGWTIWKICKRIGVAQGTVYNILHANGVVIGRHRRGGAGNPEQDALIVKMYLRGDPIDVIREETKRSITYIYSTLYANNVERRRRRAFD